jgi:hypothetical protein
MNPLPPIRPAHQPIQREPTEYTFLEEEEIWHRFAIHRQLRILHSYLEAHDPKMLVKVVKLMQRHLAYPTRAEMSKFYRNKTLDLRQIPSKETRRLIRKMIGEAHWRLYLEYHKQYLKYLGDRTKIQLSDVIVPLPPPFPTLSLKLDDHVTPYIFSFLSGKDMYEASKVSREFRDALIPRQKNVTMAGFSSFESFRQMNFIGMEYFEAGRENSIVTDDIILLMANDIESYPNLSRACLNTYISHEGYFAFETELGPRLEKNRSRVFSCFNSDS